MANLILSRSGLIEPEFRREQRQHKLALAFGRDEVRDRLLDLFSELRPLPAGADDGAGEQAEPARPSPPFLIRLTRREYVSPCGVACQPPFDPIELARNRLRHRRLPSS